MQQQYEIMVKGHLAPNYSDWLGGLSISPGFDHDEPVTVLSGPLLDQAALQGVLGTLMNMGVPLLGLRRVEPP